MRRASCGFDAMPAASAVEAAPRYWYETNSKSPHGIGIVHLVLRDHGFARVRDRERAPASPASSETFTKPWSLYWYGGPLDVRIVHGLLPHQNVSKFPAAHSLTLKANLWRHFARMQAVHGAAHFGFMPPTFSLPAELDRWRAVAVSQPPNGPSPTLQRGLYIVKPNNASRSRGIYLTRGDAQPPQGGTKPSEEEEQPPPPIPEVHGVVCAYLPPYLIGGRKFDLRLYVLVTSWCPLVVYLHSGGIARFATDPYTIEPSSLDKGTIHLTNYSFNPTAPRMMLDELKQHLEGELGSEVSRC